jgi:hypothetical protein
VRLGSLTIGLTGAETAPLLIAADASDESEGDSVSDEDGSPIED